MNEIPENHSTVLILRITLRFIPPICKHYVTSQTLKLVFSHNFKYQK